MGKEIEEQINAMIDAGMGTSPPGTEAPGTQAPGTELPGTEAPGTEAPATSAPATVAPATKAPTTEAPADDELTRAQKEITELRQQVEKLHEKKVPKTDAPKTTAPTTAVPVEEIDFLGESVDLEELTRDSKVLNAILNKVHKAGIEVGRKVQEDTLRGIPDIVKSNVTIVRALREKSEEFYEANKDLRPFSKVVAVVYEEVAAENPDWEVGKVFTEVEKETRKRLELYRKATVTEAPTTKAPKEPRFPGTKSSRQRQKPKTSSLLSEIDEMNKDQ